VEPNRDAAGVASLGLNGFEKGQLARAGSGSDDVPECYISGLDATRGVMWLKMLSSVGC
jgi:hypothetical protein